MIYKYIKKHLKNIPIQHACAFFKISQSGYYKHLHHTPSNLEIENEVLTDLIKEVHMVWDTKDDMVHEESSYICNRITNNTLVEGGFDVILHQCGLFSRGTQEENIGNN